VLARCSRELVEDRLKAPAVQNVKSTVFRIRSSVTQCGV
jgi:hypothetical protein